MQAGVTMGVTHAGRQTPDKKIMAITTMEDRDAE